MTRPAVGPLPANGASAPESSPSAPRRIVRFGGRAFVAVGRVLRMISGFGWAVLLVTASAWVVGFAWSWLELLVIAVTTTVVFAGAVAFVLGRLRYEVRFELAHRRVTMGERAVGQVVVTNPTSRALLPSVMEIPVGDGVAVFPVSRLAPGASREELFDIPTDRRAVIQVGPVRSVRADPFGILRRQMTWTEPHEVYVHPRVTHLTGSSSGYLRDLEGRVTQDISDSDISFHALRDYVPGDDHRFIHWKTTARTGQLMIRQFEETRRSHVAVLLSTRAVDYDDPSEFELAVSVCASLGLQAIRDDRGLTVLTSDGNLRGDDRTRLLDDSARLDVGDSRTSLVDLARVAGATVLDASVVMLIHGGSVTPTQLRAASSRLPQGLRVVALRCSVGASVSRRVIAELTVLTVGELSDLAFVLRRLEDR